MRNLLILFLTFWGNYIYAQDVIVKNDGSTIVSKVIEIGDREVQYKLWSNQNGPIYVLNISDIASINYENGDKEVFGNNQPFRDDSNNYSNVNQPYGWQQNNQYNIRQQNLDFLIRDEKFKLARRYTTWGCVLGGLCFGGCLIWGIIDMNAHSDNTDYTPWAPIICGSVGTVALVAPLLTKASNLKSEARKLQVTHLLQKDFKMNGHNMAANLDLIQQNGYKSFGIGAIINL